MDSTDGEKSYIIQSSSCFSYPGSNVLQNDKSFVIDSTQTAPLPCILFRNVNNRLTGKKKQTACLMATLKPNIWNLKHKYSTRWFLTHSIFYIKPQLWKECWGGWVSRDCFSGSFMESLPRWIFHTLKFGPWPCRLGNLICRQSWS